MLFSLNTNYQHGFLHRTSRSLGGGSPEEFPWNSELYFRIYVYICTPNMSRGRNRKIRVHAQIATTSSTSR